jgi:hypothetical protein
MNIQVIHVCFILIIDFYTRIGCKWYCSFYNNGNIFFRWVDCIFKNYKMAQD